MHHQKMGYLYGTLHINKHTHTTDTRTFVSCLQMGQLHSANTKKDENLCFIAHTDKHTDTHLKVQLKHSCISCQKMGHLDKTLTTKRWNIFVVRCTQTNKHTQQLHTCSSPAYSWVKIHNAHTKKDENLCSLLHTDTQTRI